MLAGAKSMGNVMALAQVFFDKIKREAHLWMLAGAKSMGNVMPRE
jgi:hypothetical protein